MSNYEGTERAISGENDVADTIPKQRENPLRASMTIADIERFQKLFGKQDPPIWRNYPLLIAAAGLLLSILTSLISSYTSYSRDIHDEQAQLASTLQSIQDLVLKRVEVAERYKDNPSEGAVVKLINAQQTTMLRTGAELALRLGKAATTSELVSISEGLYGVGDLINAEKLLQVAVAAAQNGNDAAIALRSLGYFKIRSSGSTIGRAAGDELFERAVNIEKEYDLESLPATILYLKLAGYLNWADAVARVDCPAAKKHFVDAAILLPEAPPGPDFDQVRNQVAFFNQYGIGGFTTCKPDLVTSQTIPQAVKATH